MNIFLLDNDPYYCARYHCDQHVVKMVVEYAQLLSTTWRWWAEKCPVVETNDGEINWTKFPQYKTILDRSYKKTHENHPSAIWARSGKGNYLQLLRLFDCLCNEYSRRYKKTHGTFKHFAYDGHTRLHVHFGKTVFQIDAPPPLGWHRSNTVRQMFVEEPGLYDHYDFPQCMPDQYKVKDNPVLAYRNFYKYEKSQFARYRRADKPRWMLDLATEFTTQQDPNIYNEDCPSHIQWFYQKERSKDANIESY